MQLREITTGLRFPEGPVALPDGSFLVVEIERGTLTRVDAHGGKEVVATPGGGRIERVDLQTGAVEVLYSHAGEIALKGPNDIVFDSHGGFWFTDLGKVRVNDQDRGRVFYAKADWWPPSGRARDWRCNI